MGSNLTQSLLENEEFLIDLARYADQICSEEQIRKKYRLDESQWVKLAGDDELVRKIEDTRIRRIRSGATKRELAQKHVVKGPEILSGIALDTSASARHRVDAIRTLDSMSSDNRPDAAPAGDFFQITINLSADEKIVINKPYAKTINPDADTRPTFRKPVPRNIDAEIIDHDADQGSFCFPAIAARRDDNSGGGAPR
jgi:hypothetical protein